MIEVSARMRYLMPPRNPMKKDIVSQLLSESQAYNQFEDIEKLVERGGKLTAIPIQPLFLALRATSKDYAATILPRLSPEQRQALLDIDIWKRDEIDPHAANWWLETYSMCQDQQVRSEFVRSEAFLLVVKCQCVVATFDQEEPEYPDNDNFFVTEDRQLLISYPENFPYAQELEQMVKDLYTELGVEYAYAHMMKMISDSYLILEEEQYQHKIERLRDFGFVDYMTAMEMDGVFASVEQTREWLKKRGGPTGEIDAMMKNQVLHSAALYPYSGGMDNMRDALERLADPARQDYLQFNFVRLVNARIANDDALKGGSVAMSRAGLRSRQCLELGFNFAAKEIGDAQVFKKLDFVDLYRIGHTLLSVQKKKLKKALSLTSFEHVGSQHFLGMVWNSFLENSLDAPAKLKIDGSSAAVEIRDLSTYAAWESNAETLITALPFVQQIFKTLLKLRDDHVLSDSFYLNYQVETIDFEAMMLSSFINFTLGHYERSDASKLGVRVDELKFFYQRFFMARDGEWLLKGEDPELLKNVREFTERFGFSLVPRFDRWLLQVMVEQLNGYDIMNMDEEEFKHVGGPVLLISARN